MKNNWKNFLTEGDEKAAGIIVCLDDEQRFLIIRRSDIDDRVGQWTLPGGHIDEEDDSIEQGAIRELEEEVNLSCKVSDLRHLGKKSKNKHYFLALNWTGEINVDKPNPKTKQIEHDDWRWSTINDIKDIEDTNIPIYLLEKALEMSKNETDS